MAILHFTVVLMNKENFVRSNHLVLPSDSFYEGGRILIYEGIICCVVVIVGESIGLMRFPKGALGSILYDDNLHYDLWLLKKASSLSEWDVKRAVDSKVFEILSVSSLN